MPSDVTKTCLGGCLSLSDTLTTGFHKVSSLMSVDRLEITVPVSWALNTNCYVRQPAQISCMVSGCRHVELYHFSDLIIIIIYNYCICKAQTLDKVNSKPTANQSKTHTHTHTISRHARTHAMKPAVGVVGVEQIRIIITERKTSEFLGTS